MKILMIGKNGLFCIKRISFRLIIFGPDALYVAFFWIRFTFKFSELFKSVKRGCKKFISPPPYN